MRNKIVAIGQYVLKVVVTKRKEGEEKEKCTIIVCIGFISTDKYFQQKSNFFSIVLTLLL